MPKRKRHGFRGKPPAKKIALFQFQPIPPMSPEMLRQLLPPQKKEPILFIGMGLGSEHSLHHMALPTDEMHSHLPMVFPFPEERTVPTTEEIMQNYMAHSPPPERLKFPDHLIRPRQKGN